MKRKFHVRFLEEGERAIVPSYSAISYHIIVMHRHYVFRIMTNLVTKGKLKLFRTEAVRAGFKKAWANKDYAAISVANIFNFVN